MPKIILREMSGTTWLWVALLSALFILVAAWFVDPLGYADQAEPAKTAAQSEWTLAPDGPAVPVKLPEVPVRPAGPDR
jgi:hypothetical protein